MRLYKKNIYYITTVIGFGGCVCMGAPSIGDNKISRLFFRISVFCIVSTSDSSVYHQLYQCLRSKRGRNWVITQKKTEFISDWLMGGVQWGERGWKVSLFKSSHLMLRGFISFDLRARVLLRCHFVWFCKTIYFFMEDLLIDCCLLRHKGEGGVDCFYIYLT